MITYERLLAASAASPGPRPPVVMSHSDLVDFPYYDGIGWPVALNALPDVGLFTVCAWLYPEPAANS